VQILRERHRPDGTRLTVRIPPHLRAEFEAFLWPR